MKPAEAVKLFKEFRQEIDDDQAAATLAGLVFQAKEQSQTERLLSPEEAAEFLGVGSTTFKRLKDEGQVVPINLGGRVLRYCPYRLRGKHNEDSATLLDDLNL